MSFAPRPVVQPMPRPATVRPNPPAPRPVVRPEPSRPEWTRFDLPDPDALGVVLREPVQLPPPDDLGIGVK
jgi:hypothetical protein